MRNSPHVIQLSQLKPPKLRRGRPYTVDFGIAKPLYKQLLSKCFPSATVRGKTTHFKPPTNDLFIRQLGLRIRGRFSLSGIIKASSGAHPRWKLVTSYKAASLLIWGLISFYLAIVMPLSAPQKIVYADPIIQPVAQPVVPMLTMPVVASVEPLQSLLFPVSSNLANLYVPGQCTAYVASKLPVPSNWGNAIDWGANALADGYTVSDVPKVGAIAWSVTDSYLGHVALVEAVDGDVVTISEQNYQGPFIIDTRIANPGEFRYIYL